MRLYEVSFNNVVYSLVVIWIVEIYFGQVSFFNQIHN